MPDLRPYSCLRSLGIIAVYIAALSSSILASRTCPRGCICNDQQLIARCDKSAQLDYVPHTLNPSVKELYLSHNNIRGIKSAFDLYKNLILLDLASNNLQMLGEKNFIANSRMETILLMYNNISDIQPNTFSGLFALKKLDLSYNLIEALNGTTFQQLKALQFLDLSFNNIRALNKDAFTGLHNLVHLNISNNLIVKFTFDLFQHVPNLLSLNSSFNQLESLDDDQFNPLPKLTSLDLSNCYINKVDKFAFRGMNNLRHIFLDGNYLETIPSNAFLENNIIQLLNIGRNRFQTLHSNGFANLKQLQFLYISNNSMLKDIHYNAFYGLDNLELLEISDNENLCHIGRNVFDNLFSLSSLILSNNNFTTLEVDLITRFKKSADLFLDVRGNPFNCNCSLEWLNFHFIRMFNKTISSNPEYFFGKNYTFNVFNMDSLLNNNYSDLIIRENAMEVKCATPFALQNKLVIKLHKDKFGCFVIESFVPIIIGAFFGVFIIIGVIVLFIIRCKYQLSGFVKNQLYTENTQIDLYHKPEFVFVPNSEYNTMYKDNRLEDLTARYPLRMTPITEL